jgi:hypothetical protein
MSGNARTWSTGIAVSILAALALAAKSETTVADTLKWIGKHKADFQAEWHWVEGPVQWQPDDYKDYPSTKDLFWDRTIHWTTKSDCPQFNKDLESDGISYLITRPVVMEGDVTDVGEQESTKNASYTRQTAASITWRLRIAQISAEPEVIDFKEYQKRTNQNDNRTVDVGTYYYICIHPKATADPDAIVQIDNDQTVNDGRGHVTVVTGRKNAVAFAGVATVHEKAMADRLANAIGHLISLLQAQAKPKEEF